MEPRRSITFSKTALLSVSHKSSICPPIQLRSILILSPRPRRPVSVVGIATGYGLDCPGIESSWVRDFPHLSRPALWPTQPPVQWVLCVFRGYRAAGAWRWPSCLLVSWSRKSRAMPLLTLWAVGLCRASVAVQVCTLPYPCIPQLRIRLPSGLLFSGFSTKTCMHLFPVCATCFSHFVVSIIRISKG